MNLLRISLLLLLASLASAQAPAVGVLDFFGLNKVAASKLRQTLGVKEGDPLPPSKGDAEERVDTVPGVVESHLEAVCCDDGKVILYLGIEERGAPHFELHDPPEAEIALPLELTSTYREFLDAFAAAVKRGSTAEDLTNGHSLMADPLAHEIQLQFPAMASEHTGDLRNVLRNSYDEEQRAIAAYLLGYAPRKSEIVDDLQYALRDADAGVRANAVQALLAIMVYARLHPQAGIKIQPTWFIEMLNSVSFSDREHALKALQLLTDVRDSSTLDQLRDRALPGLIEMARWKTLAHALPAFLLVGRLAGLTEQQIQDAWSRGDRETVISAANPGKSR